MKQLICKECGRDREVGRRLCRSCNSQRLINIVRSKPRYTWTKICEACKNEFQAWRKNQKICSNCNVLNRELKAQSKNTNKYIFTNTPGRTEHRNIAEIIIGRKLNTNEVVHHMDDNPVNNSVSNLLIISRSMHGKLHLYLDLQRVILEKSGIENIEKCWNTLIVPMTTAWLETTSAKVIKLWEIGQSAAEPLKEKSDEEGSETMHDASVTGKAVEDDIVQTTTMIVG